MTRDTLTTPRWERLRSQVLSLLLAVSGWIVLGIVKAQPGTAAATAAVFGFVLICPGAALIRLLPVRNLLERAVLGIAIGLSLAALAAEAGALGRPMQAPIVLIVLALVCTAASLPRWLRG